MRFSRAWTVAASGPGEQRPAQHRDGEGDGERGHEDGGGHGGHQNLIFTVLLSHRPPTSSISAATASIT